MLIVLVYDVVVWRRKCLEKQTTLSKSRNSTRVEREFLDGCFSKYLQHPLILYHFSPSPRKRYLEKDLRCMYHSKTKKTTRSDAMLRGEFFRQYRPHNWRE